MAKVNATTQREGTRRRIITVEPWDYNEVSTRNCLYCLACHNCYKVLCLKGIPLSKDGAFYTFNYIVRKPVLIAPCRNCAEFNNQWNKEK